MRGGVAQPPRTKQGHQGGPPLSLVLASRVQLPHSARLALPMCRTRLRVPESMADTLSLTPPYHPGLSHEADAPSLRTELNQIIRGHQSCTRLPFGPSPHTPERHRQGSCWPLSSSEEKPPPPTQSTGREPGAAAGPITKQRASQSRTWLFPKALCPSCAAHMQRGLWAPIFASVLSSDPYPVQKPAVTLQPASRMSLQGSICHTAVSTFLYSLPPCKPSSPLSQPVDVLPIQGSKAHLPRTCLWSWSLCPSAPGTQHLVGGACVPLVNHLLWCTEHTPFTFLDPAAAWSACPMDIY